MAIELKPIKYIDYKVYNVTTIKNKYGAYVVYTNVTVQTYMEYWYEYIVKDRLKSEGSVDTYKNCIFNHIIPNIGKIKLVELKKGHIKKLYKQVFDYSPSVARILQIVVNTSLKEAKIKKFIPTNVADGIKLPNKDKKTTTKEEQKKRIL